MGTRQSDLKGERIVRALGDLFRNPMPHDLIAIRREVEREYGGDEKAAKDEMDAWCSQEYMEQQITAHREAWHNAAEVLREYSPNPARGYELGAKPPTDAAMSDGEKDQR